jgi:5-methylcytosine-specific restriction endonuclease McrA
MSVRKLSTITWSFTNSGFGINFQHNKIKHQLSYFEHDLIVGISTVQPVAIGLVNKHRHYWLYRNEVYTTSSDADGDKIIKHNERLKRESMDDLTKLLLKQMKASQQQYDEIHRQKLQSMKQQNQQFLKSLKQTHEQTIKLLMKRTKPSKHSRYIPQDVKIQVVIRDNGMCQSPGCFTTSNLHFDHIYPYSKGGRSNDVNNIQLLCSKHNLKKSNQI